MEMLKTDDSEKELDKTKILKHIFRSSKDGFKPKHRVLQGNIISTSRLDLEQKFVHNIQALLKEAIQDDNSQDFNLPKDDLKNLKIEAAKLKSTGRMKHVPLDIILKFLTTLKTSIEKRTYLTQIINNKKNKDNKKQIFHKSSDQPILASFTSLYILTSVNMPSRIYIEDLIEQIILLTDQEVRNNIQFIGSKITKNMDNKLNKKYFVKLSHSISEILLLLAELVALKKLNDHLVLQVTSLGLMSVFSSLEYIKYSSIQLLIAVFRNYDKHRKILLDDILSSVSGNSPQHSYKLSSGKQVMSFTALSLQLVQGIVNFPSKIVKESTYNIETLILDKWKSAKFVIHTFTNDFITKITKRQGKESRSILDNFIEDLILLLNKPEWPSAEFFLMALSNLSVNSFFKSTDISLRLFCMDLLCNISLTIQKDMTVKEKFTLDKIIKVTNFNPEENDENKLTKQGKIVMLQNSLISYLNEKSINDSSFADARSFYLVQWYHNICLKINAMEGCSKTSGEQKTEESLEDLIYSQKHLQEKITNCIPYNSSGKLSIIDYSKAKRIVKHFYYERNFYNNFNFFISYIAKGLRKENPAIIRTKAVKGLANVIKIDTSILNKDIEQDILNMLLDSSPLVRESATDLLGKLILSKPEFFPSYYPSLAPRILDTSIAVRKRVVRIFIDLCSKYPNHQQITEIYLKLACRINDEDSIRTMIEDLFRKNWFEPVDEIPKLDFAALKTKVSIMINTVEKANEMNISFFEIIIRKIFQESFESNANIKSCDISKSLLTSCKQIIDCLMKSIIELENTKKSLKVKSCLMLILQFSKHQPQLLIPYATNLQPYLLIKCSDKEDYAIVSYAVRILSDIIPLMIHPCPTFLTQLEEVLIKLITQHDPGVIVNSVSCLAKILKMTKNYDLLKNCYSLYFSFIEKTKELMERNGSSPDLWNEIKPSLNRSIFVVGLLIEHFDLTNLLTDDSTVTEEHLKNKITKTLLYFLNSDINTQLCVFKAVGHVCIKYCDLLLDNDIKSVFIRTLSENNVSIQIKVQIFNNLQCFLLKEDLKFSTGNEKSSKQNKIKELAEVHLGRATSIIQHYLDSIIDGLLNVNDVIRNTSLKLVRTILIQGLIYPLQIVPYIISLGTDSNENTRNSADELLFEIEKKYPGYSYTKAQSGVHLSFDFQKALNENNIVRGYKIHEGSKTALNSFLYSLMKTKNQKHSFLLSLIKHFDEHSKCDIELMLYIADNLAYLPYKVLDEPLFIIYQIDVILSITGSHIVHIFQENISTDNESNSNDEEDKALPEETLVNLLPEDTTPLQSCIKSARACLILGQLKKHLKKMYNINFKKIEEYSSYDNKTKEHTISSRNGSIDFIKNAEDIVLKKHELDNLTLVKQFLTIKKLVYNLDTDPERRKTNTDTCSANIGIHKRNLQDQKDNLCSAIKLQTHKSPNLSGQSTCISSRTRKRSSKISQDSYENCSLKNKSKNVSTICAKKKKK